MQYMSDDFTNETNEGFSQRSQGENKWAARRHIARNGKGNGKKPKGKEDGFRKFRPHNHHAQNDMDMGDDVSLCSGWKD
jgi:hypothetical protein